MTAQPTEQQRSTVLAWFEIYVSDIAMAREFYGQVFGWTFEPLEGFPFGEYLLIGGDGGGGIAQAPEPPRPGPESTLVYVSVDDIPATIEAAVAAGGAVHRPHMNIGGDHGWCAIVKDPEGNYVGLWSDH